MTNLHLARKHGIAFMVFRGDETDDDLPVMAYDLHAAEQTAARIAKRCGDGARVVVELDTGRTVTFWYR